MGSGNYVIIQHQKNLRSYYLHLKDDSINKTNSFIKEGEVIALTSNTGHSYGVHLHFSIENTQLQEMLNPLLYFRDNLQNKLSPKIEGILMQTGNNKIKPIPGIIKMKDNMKMNLCVKCYAFMHDQKNNMCPYKITCFINKEKYIEYTFDKLIIKNNNYFMPPNYSFNDIYADKDTFILGVINLQKQDYTIEVIVEDIFGNQSKAKKVFRVL